MSENGPRIVFKSGDKGAFMHARHFHDPWTCRLLAVAAETAPPLRKDVLVVTEGWRKGTPGKRDQHTHFKGLDIRTGIESPNLEGAIVGSPNSRINRIRAAKAWCERMEDRLGTDYDIVFGDSRHINHIHGEHDP
jgi:hypothetical protein